MMARMARKASMVVPVVQEVEKKKVLRPKLTMSEFQEIVQGDLSKSRERADFALREVSIG